MSNEAGQEVLMFESEEARDAAIAALEEIPENLERLERITNAVIAPTPTDAQGGEAGTQEAGPQAAADAPPAEEPAAAPTGPITLSPEDLKAAGFTYRTREDVLKGLTEKEAFIERQKERIRELQEAGGVEAQRRIADLEAELARRQAAQPPSGLPPVNVSGKAAEAQQKVDALKRELAEMDAIEDAATDPYDLPEDFHRKQRSLIKLHAEATSDLLAAVAQSTEAAERQRAQEQEAKRAREEEVQRDRYRQTTFKEMDEVASDPDFKEYKFSKSAAEAEKEYLAWRADVAAAFFERPARSADEMSFALAQLEARNPELVRKCQLAGVPAEPHGDVDKYLQLCEMMDYRDGWTRNKQTGQLERWEKYDPATGRMVPVMFPSLKAAIEQRRLGGGYYNKKINNAYQAGADALARAQAKRDTLVTELGGQDTIGSTGSADAEWAARYLEGVDTDDVMRKVQNGDRSALDMYNKARAVFGIEPVSFDT